METHSDKLQVNVSAEADAAFMRELQRTDPPRYDRLMAAIAMAHASHGTAASPNGPVCAYALCQRSTAHLRAGSSFCSPACKMKAARLARKS
jgi:hypothetical protein